MHLILIGLTGSGKTALAQALLQRWEGQQRQPPSYIATGAIAREISRSDTSTALALKQGALAPEQAMRQAVQRQLEEADVQHGGWLLDGFPRTIAQLICLHQWTAAMPTYVYLDVPTLVCLERLTKREREDDHPDSIARKLELFDQLTRPMLDILERGGALHRVPGNGFSVEELADRVENLLG